MVLKVLIIGGGQVAAQILSLLQLSNQRFDITLVSEECHLPYQRPPLSKSFFQPDFDRERLMFRDEVFYATMGVTLRLGVRATRIDRARSEVQLSSGELLTYDRLVLATGARARLLRLPGASFPNVCYLRSLDDAVKLSAYMRSNGRAVIIGGGYVGLELAASARKEGMEVVLLEAADRILGRVASSAVSDAIATVHRANGVDLRTSATVVRFDGAQAAESVVLQDGKRIAADLVVVGVGAVPNDELARDAGLEVDGGVIVDDAGCTSDPRIFAAGDCTCSFVSRLIRYVRYESVPHANEQAKTIAAMLCEKPPQGFPPPWFWSEQYDVRLQMVGLMEGYDTSVIRHDPMSDGVAFTEFYIQNQQMIAAASINCPKDFMVTRRALAVAPRPVDPSKLADLSVPLATTLAYQEPA
ncbi:NAD(P)/FAD-dependent oxidoreductase [Paraburkholderia sp.]|uniref:NAD(P)/FAD-dependent oxidoreductase n=1 Tax=Paraburkholderia sp. TaxID=1926495 RepID=UPI003C7ACCF0